MRVNGFPLWVRVLDARDWLVLLGCTAGVGAAIGLALASDISWVFVALLSFGYALVIGRIRYQTLNRVRLHKWSEGANRNSGGTSDALKWSWLGASYWIFFIIVMGLVTVYGAVAQLTTRSTTAFSLLLLGIGGALIGAGILGIVAMMRIRR